MGGILYLVHRRQQPIPKLVTCSVMISKNEFGIYFALSSILIFESCEVQQTALKQQFIYKQV